MKFFEYINSRDVAEYLEKINYPFSPIEAAWLVWQSNNHTMEEKHAAWRGIIDTTEDCSLESPNASFKYKESLHGYLQAYMDMENAFAEEFLRPDDHCVYTYKTLFADDNSWCEELDIFANFEEAFASFSEDSDLNPRFVEFTKTKLGSCGPKIYCRMTPDKKITKIGRDALSDTEAEIFYYFNDLNFHFPTPFKEGDILQTVNGKYTRLPPVGGIFVICYKAGENGSGNDEEKQPYGYFVDSNDNVYCEQIDDSVIKLIDCEYVRSELEDEDRLLISIGNYFKGKIDIAGLWAAHRIMTLEHSLNVSREALIFKQNEKEDMGLSFNDT